jgi:hypothetical protein
MTRLTFEVYGEDEGGESEVIIRAEITAEGVAIEVDGAERSLDAEQAIDFARAILAVCDESARPSVEGPEDQ